MEIKRTILLTQLLAVIILLTYCADSDTKEKPFESGIVAYVGEQAISARQFKLNYEFGFAHLKHNPDKKYSYLEYMIREILLSTEGYHLGLDKIDRVQNLEKHLLEELLVEALFKKEVDETIRITPEQVIEAINKSQVRWKLRYWVEPVLEEAEYAYQAMQEQGYKSFVQDVLANNTEITYQLKDFETEYLTWLDIAPELLETINILQIGELSKPIRLNDSYYIFQVTDIQRGLISEYDYQNTYKRFEQILFYRKLEDEMARYISEFIAPKNIITQAQALQTMENALIEWIQQGKKQASFMEAIENTIDHETDLWKLQKQLEEVLVSYEGEQFSINEIVTRFDPETMKIKSTNREQFHNQFKKQITRTIRNYIFVKEAKFQGLEKTTEVQDQLNTWRDKWVYEEMRQAIISDIEIDDSEVKAYFKNSKSRYVTDDGTEPEFIEFASQAKQHAQLEQTHLLLEKKIQLLKKLHTVQINKAVLDTVSIIDIKKSNWANLLLFRNNTGQMAIPVVDPRWSL